MKLTYDLRPLGVSRLPATADSDKRTLAIPDRGLYLSETEISVLMDLLVDAFGYGETPPMGRRRWDADAAAADEAARVAAYNAKVTAFHDRGEPCS